MTRNKKLLLAGTFAGLVGAVALVGAVQADPPRGYGPGYGHMGGYGPGSHMQSYGRGGDHHMWRGERDDRGQRGDRGMMGGAGMMGQMFDEADADKDGKLTQEEVDAYRDARFGEFDANGDGRLSLDEFTALHNDLAKQMTVRAFQMHDPDGDGAITKEEFDRPTAGLVQRMDRNNDGVLTRVDPRRDGRGWGPMHGWGWGPTTDDDNDDN